MESKKDPKKSYLAAFTFHGVVTREEKGKEVKADCPFCGKESHFCINKDTGQWNCLSCGVKGNMHTFLQHTYRRAFAATTSKHFKQLAESRGLPPAVFKESGVAWDEQTHRWMFPVFNTKGAMANLHVWSGVKGDKVFSTAGCSLHLCGEHIQPFTNPVYVCEGFWDGYALQWLLSQRKAKGTVVSVPGASVFKDEWGLMFKDLDVVLLYDNDGPGGMGTRHAASKLIGARSVRFLHWPSTTPEKYDVSDLIRDNIHHQGSILANIERLLESLEKPDEPGKKRTRTGKPPSFAKVLKTFHEHIHLDKNMESALGVMLATVLSNFIPGDPLWLFLVGPPGAGKTLFLEALSKSPICHYESSITRASLVSGWKDPNGQNSSLAPKLKDRCLVLKDYTEIKAMSGQAQEELYGVLRGLYDGNISRTFGNQVKIEFNDCFFSMIAGVTDIIHGDERASLGERFIKCEFIDEDHDSEKHIRMALSSMAKKLEGEKVLREVCSDFLDRDYDKLKIPSCPAWVENRLVPLAQIVAYLRATVHRSWKEEIKYRTRPEIATRLSRQLKKLGQALCLVFGKGVIDMEVYKIMEKMAFDTSIGWNIDILRMMMAHYPTPMTITDMKIEGNIPETSLKRRLDDLMELKVVEHNRITTGKIGQPPFGYTVSDTIAGFWKRAKLPEGQFEPSKNKKGKTHGSDDTDRPVGNENSGQEAPGSKVRGNRVRHANSLGGKTPI